MEVAFASRRFFYIFRKEVFHAIEWHVIIVEK